MNTRYQPPAILKPSAQTVTEAFPYNPFIRKVPLRVFPVLPASYLSEKTDFVAGSTGNRSQIETPRLPEPEDLANLDYLERIPTASSEFQTEDSSLKSARTLFNHRFYQPKQESTTRARSSSASSAYVQTEPTYRSKTYALTPAKDTSKKLYETNSVISARSPNPFKPSEVLANSNNKHVNRFAYNSYESYEGTPGSELERSNQSSTRKYTTIRPFSSSPKSSAKKKGYVYTSNLGFIYTSNTGSVCKLTEDNPRIKQSLVGKIVRKSRDGSSTARKASPSVLTDSNALSHRAKVEAFFWDPADQNAQKSNASPPPSANKSQLKEHSSYFPEETFNAKSEIISQMFHELHSVCPETINTPNQDKIDSGFYKKLESSFSKPMNQNNVVTERNMSSLFNSAVLETNRDSVQKPLQLDGAKEQETCQQPDMPGLSNKNDTQEIAFKKKNIAAVTDTTQLSINQMKRIGSPNTYESRAKVLKAKESKGSDEPEPDWCACTTESEAGSVGVNVIRTREMSPNPANKTLRNSASAGPLCSARDKSATIVPHKEEPVMEVSSINESISLSLDHSSDCNVSKSFEELLSGEPSKSHSISELAAGSANPSQIADPNYTKNCQLVNEQIQLLEKKLSKLILNDEAATVVAASSLKG